MTQISDRTILFADLRGSTGLYETLGNAEATSVVTHCVSALGPPVEQHGGHVVKTLGDGLMAVFDAPARALQAALQMHEVLAGIVQRGGERGASTGLRSLRLQVALAHGEVVEMAGDCFGDAVNVAARLLDHAGDNETLVTAPVLAGLSRTQQAAVPQPRPDGAARPRRAGAGVRVRRAPQRRQRGHAVRRRRAGRRA